MTTEVTFGGPRQSGGGINAGGNRPAAKAAKEARPMSAKKRRFLEDKKK